MVLFSIARFALFAEGVLEEVPLHYERSWDGSIWEQELADLPPSITPKFIGEYSDDVLTLVRGFYIGTRIVKFVDTIQDGKVTTSTYFAPDGSTLAEYTFRRERGELVEIEIWGPSREVNKAAGTDSRWADVRGSFLFRSGGEQTLIRGRVSFEDSDRLGEESELFVDGGVAAAGTSVERAVLRTKGSLPLFSRFRERLTSDELGLPRVYTTEEADAGVIMAVEWTYGEERSTVQRVETLLPGIEDIATTHVTTANVTNEYPGSRDFVERSRREFSSVGGGTISVLYSRGFGQYAELEQYAVEAAVFDEKRRIQSAQTPWQSDTTSLRLLLVPQGFGGVGPSRWAVGVRLPIPDTVASGLAAANLPDMLRSPLAMWTPELPAWP